MPKVFCPACQGLFEKEEMYDHLDTCEGLVRSSPASSPSKKKSTSSKKNVVVASAAKNNNNDDDAQSSSGTDLENDNIDSDLDELLNINSKKFQPEINNLKTFLCPVNGCTLAFGRFIHIQDQKNIAKPTATTSPSTSASITCNGFCHRKLEPDQLRFSCVQCNVSFCMECAMLRCSPRKHILLCEDVPTTAPFTCTVCNKLQPKGSTGKSFCRRCVDYFLCSGCFKKYLGQVQANNLVPNPPTLATDDKGHILQRQRTSEGFRCDECSGAKKAGMVSYSCTKIAAASSTNVCDYDLDEDCAFKRHSTAVVNAAASCVAPANQVNFSSSSTSSVIYPIRDVKGHVLKFSPAAPSAAFRTWKCRYCETNFDSKTSSSFSCTICTGIEYCPTCAKDKLLAAQQEQDPIKIIDPQGHRLKRQIIINTKTWSCRKCNAEFISDNQTYSYGCRICSPSYDWCASCALANPNANLIPPPPPPPSNKNNNNNKNGDDDLDEMMKILNSTKKPSASSSSNHNNNNNNNPPNFFQVPGVIVNNNKKKNDDDDDDQQLGMMNNNDRFFTNDDFGNNNHDNNDDDDDDQQNNHNNNKQSSKSTRVMFMMMSPEPSNDGGSLQQPSDHHLLGAVPSSTGLFNRELSSMQSNNVHFEKTDSAEYQDVARSIGDRFQLRQQEAARQFCTDLIPDEWKAHVPAPNEGIWTRRAFVGQFADPFVGSTELQGGVQNDSQELLAEILESFSRFSFPDMQLWFPKKIFENLNKDKNAEAAFKTLADHFKFVANILRSSAAHETGCPQPKRAPDAAVIKHAVFGLKYQSYQEYDVTNQVKSLVKNGKLKIPARSYTKLFGTPSIPYVQTLKIEFNSGICPIASPFKAEETVDTDLKFGDGFTEGTNEYKEQELKLKGEHYSKKIQDLKAGDIFFFPCGWRNGPKKSHAVTMLFRCDASNSSMIDVILCNSGAGCEYGTSVDAFPKKKITTSMSLGAMPKSSFGPLFFYAFCRCKSIDDSLHGAPYFYEHLLPALFANAKPSTWLPEELSTPRTPQYAGTCFHKSIVLTIKALLSHRGLDYRQLKSVFFAVRLMMLQMAYKDLKNGGNKPITVSDEKLLRIACHQVMRKAEKGRTQDKEEKKWIDDQLLDVATNLCSEVLCLLPDVLVDAPRVRQPLIGTVNPDERLMEQDVAHPFMDLLLVDSKANRTNADLSSLMGVTAVDSKILTLTNVTRFTSIEHCINTLGQLRSAFSNDALAQASAARMGRFIAFTSYERIICNVMGLPDHDVTAFWSGLVKTTINLKSALALVSEIRKTAADFVRLWSGMPDSAMLVSSRYIIHTVMVAQIDTLLRMPVFTVSQVLKNFNSFNPLHGCLLMSRMIHDPSLLALMNAINFHFYEGYTGAGGGGGRKTIYEPYFNDAKQSDGSGNLEYRIDDESQLVDVTWYEQLVEKLQCTLPDEDPYKNLHPIQRHLYFINLNRFTFRADNFKAEAEAIHQFQHCYMLTRLAACDNRRKINPELDDAKIDFTYFSNCDGGIITLSHNIGKLQRPYAPDAQMASFRRLLWNPASEREMALRPRQLLVEGLPPEFDVTVKQLFSTPYVGVPLLLDELARRGSWKMSFPLQKHIDAFLFEPRQWGSAPRPTEAPISTTGGSSSTSFTPTTHLNYCLQTVPSAIFVPLSKILRLALEEDLGTELEPAFFHCLRLCAYILGFFHNDPTSSNYLLAASILGRPNVEVEGLVELETDLFGATPASALSRLNRFLKRPQSAKDDKNMRAYVLAHRSILLNAHRKATWFERASASISAITRLNGFCNDEEFVDNMALDISVAHSVLVDEYVRSSSTIQTNQAQMKQMLDAAVTDLTGVICDETWKLSTTENNNNTNNNTANGTSSIMYTSASWAVYLQTGLVTSRTTDQAPSYLPPSVAQAPECRSVFGDSVVRCQVSDVKKNCKTFRILQDETSSTDASNNSSTQINVKFWTHVALTKARWAALGAMQKTGAASPAFKIGSATYPCANATKIINSKLADFFFHNEKDNNKKGILAAEYQMLGPAFAAEWKNLVDEDYRWRTLALNTLQVFQPSVQSPDHLRFLVGVSSEGSDLSNFATIKEDAEIALSEIHIVHVGTTPVLMWFSITFDAGRMVRALTGISHHDLALASRQIPNAETDQVASSFQVARPYCTSGDYTLESLPYDSVQILVSFKNEDDGVLEEFDLLTSVATYGTIPEPLLDLYAPWHSKRDNQIYFLKKKTLPSRESIQKCQIKCSLCANRKDGFYGTISQESSVSAFGTTFGATTATTAAGTLASSGIGCRILASPYARHSNKTLTNLISCLLRLNGLSQVMPWMIGSFDENGNTFLKISDTTVEIPRLHLRFKAMKSLNPRGEEVLRFASVQHAGWFICDMISNELLQLLHGFPHGVLLQTDAQNLSLLLPSAAMIRPAIAKSPLSTTTIANHLSVTNAPNRVYRVDIHTATMHFFPDSLEIALYLIHCKLLARDYQDAALLAEGAATEAALDRREKRILAFLVSGILNIKNAGSDGRSAAESLFSVASPDIDTHPNALAVLLRVFIAIGGSDFNVGSCSLLPVKQVYERYMKVVGHVSANLRLPLDDEVAYFGGERGASNNNNNKNNENNNENDNSDKITASKEEDEMYKKWIQLRRDGTPAVFTKPQVEVTTATSAKMFLFAKHIKVDDLADDGSWKKFPTALKLVPDRNNTIEDLLQDRIDGNRYGQGALVLLQLLCGRPIKDAEGKVWAETDRLPFVRYILAHRHASLRGHQRRQSDDEVYLLQLLTLLAFSSTPEERAGKLLPPISSWNSFFSAKPTVNVNRYWCGTSRAWRDSPFKTYLQSIKETVVQIQARTAKQSSHHETGIRKFAFTFVPWWIDRLRSTAKRPSDLNSPDRPVEKVNFGIDDGTSAKQHQTPPNSSAGLAAALMRNTSSSRHRSIHVRLSKENIDVMTGRPLQRVVQQLMDSSQDAIERLKAREAKEAENDKKEKEKQQQKQQENKNLPPLPPPPSTNNNNNNGGGGFMKSISSFFTNNVSGIFNNNNTAAFANASAASKKSVPSCLIESAISDQQKRPGGKDFFERMAGAAAFTRDAKEKPPAHVLERLLLSKSANPDAITAALKQLWRFLFRNLTVDEKEARMAQLWAVEHAAYVADETSGNVANQTERNILRVFNSVDQMNCPNFLSISRLLLSSKYHQDLSLGNPFLASDQQTTKDIARVTIASMLRASRAMQIRACLNIICTALRMIEDENVHERDWIAMIQSLVSTLNATRLYTDLSSNPPRLNPKLLLFEYLFDVILWGPQLELVAELTKNAVNGESYIRNLLMGLGKSSTVAPLLALNLADHLNRKGEGGVVVLTVPPALTAQTIDVVGRRFCIMSGSPVLQVVARRYGSAQSAFKKIEIAKKCRGLVICEPDDIKSIQLRLAEQFLDKADDLGFGNSSSPSSRATGNNNTNSKNKKPYNTELPQCCSNPNSKGDEGDIRYFIAYQSGGLASYGPGFEVYVQNPDAEEARDFSFYILNDKMPGAAVLKTLRRARQSKDGRADVITATLYPSQVARLCYVHFPGSRATSYWPPRVHVTRNFVPKSIPHKDFRGFRWGYNLSADSKCEIKTYRNGARQAEIWCRSENEIDLLVSVIVKPEKRVDAFIDPVGETTFTDSNTVVARVPAKTAVLICRMISTADEPQEDFYCEFEYQAKPWVGDGNNNNNNDNGNDKKAGDNDDDDDDDNNNNASTAAAAADVTAAADKKKAAADVKLSATAKAGDADFDAAAVFDKTADGNFGFGDDDDDGTGTAMNPSILAALSKGICIIDEADVILNPTKSELNFPIGAKNLIELGAPRWEFCMYFLRRALDGLDKKFQDLAVNRIPHLHVVSLNWFRDFFKPWLATAAAKAIAEVHELFQLAILSNSNTTTSSSSIAASAKLTATQIKEIEKFIADDKKAENPPVNVVNPPTAATSPAMLVLAKIWVHQLAEFVLCKIHNVAYGFPSDERQRFDPDRIVAVPYMAQAVPSATSEFAHPDIAAGFTYLTFRHRGMRALDMRALVSALREKLNIERGPIHERRTSILFQTLCRGGIGSGNGNNNTIPDGKYDHVPALADIDPFNERQLQDVAHQFGRVHTLVEYYLGQIVFPRILKFSERKLHASAQDLANKIIFPCVVGFTGTAEDTAPTACKIAHSPGDLAKILSTLSDETIIALSVLDGANTRPVQIVKSIVSSGNFDAIIDCGGLITGLQNEEVARLVLKYLADIGSPKQACVFLDAKNNQVFLSRTMLEEDEAEPQPVVECNYPLSQRFVFFDQAHCTGTDVKQSSIAHAALLIGKDDTLRDVAQAVWRMRQLGRSTQHATFYVPSSVLALINSNPSLVMKNNNNENSSNNHNIIRREKLITWLALKSLDQSEAGTTRRNQQEGKEADERRAATKVLTDPASRPTAALAAVVKQLTAPLQHQVPDKWKISGGSTAGGAVDSTQEQQKQQQQQQQQQQASEFVDSHLKAASDKRWSLTSLSKGFASNLAKDGFAVIQHGSKSSSAPSSGTISGNSTNLAVRPQSAASTNNAGAENNESRETLEETGGIFVPLCEFEITSSFVNHHQNTNNNTSTKGGAAAVVAKSNDAATTTTSSPSSSSIPFGGIQSVVATRNFFRVVHRDFFDPPYYLTPLAVLQFNCSPTVTPADRNQIALVNLKEAEAIFLACVEGSVPAGLNIALWTTQGMLLCRSNNNNNNTPIRPPLTLLMTRFFRCETSFSSEETESLKGQLKINSASTGLPDEKRKEQLGDILTSLFSKRRLPTVKLSETSYNQVLVKPPSWFVNNKDGNNNKNNNSNNNNQDDDNEGL